VAFADGLKHLGNYIGAINPYVAGPGPRGTRHLRVVDLHAITVSSTPQLRERVYYTTAIRVAAGADPGALRALPPGRRQSTPS